MITTLPPKDPAEVLDYLIDWSGALGADTIVEAGSSVEVTGGTLDSVDYSATSLTAWISGGVAGEIIRVTSEIGTSGGRTLRRLFVIPYGEPVSLEMAKKHCRIELADDSEDELLALYIRAGREWVEKFTGHILVARDVDEYRDAFDNFIELRRAPVIGENIRIDYIDSDGSPASYGDFITSQDRFSTRLYPARDGWWPSLGLYGGVTITYDAGYPEGEVPSSLVHAVQLLVGHWYTNRESVVTGTIATEVPMTVQALCMPYRRLII